VRGSNVGVEVLLLKTAIVCRKAHGVAGIYGLGFALSTSGYSRVTPQPSYPALLTRGSRRKLICELGKSQRGTVQLSTDLESSRINGMGVNGPDATRTRLPRGGMLARLCLLAAALCEVSRHCSMVDVVLPCVGACVGACACTSVCVCICGVDAYQYMCGRTRWDWCTLHVGGRCVLPLFPVDAPGGRTLTPTCVSRATQHRHSGLSR
jgi:hypothetical protein